MTAGASTQFTRERVVGQFPNGDHSGRARCWPLFVRIPWAREEPGEVCCAIDSHVDRTFLIEVFLVSAAGQVLRAVHHEQVPPTFSSNTHITGGVLCPKKSIRSIKSSTVR